MSYHDYESWGRVDWSKPRKAEILEAWSGSDIVRWWGRIERQLKGMRDEAEQGRNFPAQEKVQGFLNIWRNNQLTGSINIEQLTPLAAASDMLALDNNAAISSYFGSLRDSLNSLIASEEELPRGADMEQNDPLVGGGAGGPPMDPEFGAEDVPPGEEGEEGADGQPPNDIEPPGEGGIPEESPGDAEGETAPEPESMRL